MNKLTIGDFEGPLDLLLHLIKKSKMEIMDIKISEITAQYLDFIHESESINLDISSEYLVMAAELIEMKSRKLVPNNNLEEDTTEDIEDPEEELKRRLLEYQKYKESTLTFKSLEEKRNNYYTKSPEVLKKYSNEKLENDGSVGIFDLLDAFQKLLDRQNFNKPVNTKIARKELSVSARIDKIRSMFANKSKIKFEELFEEFNKPYVVVTFLSILEMAKNKEIIIKQKDNFSEIYLEKVN